GFSHRLKWFQSATDSTLFRSTSGRGKRKKRVLFSEGKKDLLIHIKHRHIYHGAIFVMPSNRVLPTSADTVALSL
ncbi:hypothetical protein, partial [Bacteroides heparinolyticus]|uniref:hypothetical protein n=1 Tax=Prevotella heparinolytica TaxID=28113 RepID=UPI00359F1984